MFFHICLLDMIPGNLSNLKHTPLQISILPLLLCYLLNIKIIDLIHDDDFNRLLFILH